MALAASRSKSSAAAGKRPDHKPLAHPLAGADPLTLLSVFAQAGGVPMKAWPQAGAALGASLARLPLSLSERAYAGILRRGRPLDPAPIFLVGHWRSGTTHLYNVLAKADFGFVDPIAAGLPWDLLLLGRWLRPLLVRMLPEGRFIDPVAVNADSPQEDEIAIANMTALSFYHAIYFPRRFEHFYWRGLLLDGATPSQVRQWERCFDHLLWKLQHQQPGKPLLIKNPVYTARVAQLARLYPGARFIHIVRNPHEVFASTRAFFGKLFEALALQPADGVDVERVVLETYPRLMDPLLRDTANLPPGRFVEMTFDALEQQPLVELERIYETLGLPGFDAARPRFEDYLGSVRGYTRAPRGFPARDVDLVERQWGRFIDHWGFQRPATL